MSYRLVRFAGTTLPSAGMTIEFGPPDARDPYSALLDGGTFNHYPDGAPTQLPQNMTVRAEIVAASLATMRTTYDELASLVTRRYKLLRAAVDDATEQWTWATLTGVRPTRAPLNLYWFPIQLEWQIECWPWRGTAHNAADILGDPPYIQFENGLYYTVSNPETLTTGTNTMWVENGGDFEVDDCGIVVMAGDSAITALTIGVTGQSEIEYTGNIAAGKMLIIDCGNQSVLNDGVYAWPDLQRTTNHAIRPWLALTSHWTEVTVTIVGGGSRSTIQFTYSDGWA